MKKHMFASACLALSIASLAGAQSQTPGPSSSTQAPNKIGVIQIQSAIASTRDGQKAAAELETRMGPKRKEMERKQTELRDLQDKLQRGGNAMAENAKQELMRTIDQKTKVYNRDMQDAQDELDQEQRKILDELGQKMMQVIDKYAVANGYSVILDVSSPNTPVLYASNAVDITKDIIDLYDKSAPSAPAAKPSGGVAAPPKTITPAPTAPAPPVKKQP